MKIQGHGKTYAHSQSEPKKVYINPDDIAKSVQTFNDTSQIYAT